MKKESVRVCIVNVCIHIKPWEEGDSKGVKNRLTAGTETDRIIYNSDEISSQRMDADRHGSFFWKHVHNNISACAWMCVFAHSGLHSSWFWAPVGGSGTPSGPHGSAGPSSPAHECLQIRWTSTHTHTNTVLLDSLTLNAKHNKAGLSAVWSCLMLVLQYEKKRRRS